MAIIDYIMTMMKWPMTMFQEQGLNKLVECMALNSASTSSESESEVSEVNKVLSLLVGCFVLPEWGESGSKTL